MLKSQLRKEALAKRIALSSIEVSLLSQKLLEQFKKLDFSKVNNLHTFLPIAHKNEPDTFLLINWLRETHPEIRIFVPRADFDGFTMSHHEFGHNDELIHNVYRIPEPLATEAYAGQFDMVIVPLLAFDRHGFRVGYGKGFYDRFLQGTGAEKIGLSFFSPVNEINDVHLNDVRLDKCITPEGTITFQ